MDPQALAKQFLDGPIAQELLNELGLENNEQGRKELEKRVTQEVEDAMNELDQVNGDSAICLSAFLACLAKKAIALVAAG